MKLEQILKDSNYSLSLFTVEEIDELENRIVSRDVRGKNTYFVRCLVREKEIQIKPEEVVRQLYLYRLMNDYGYDRKSIAVEFPVKFGSATKKADIVIRDKKHRESAYIIVELKKPKWKDGKDQLKSYCHATGAPIGVWTNGTQISYYHRKDPNYFEDLTDIPKLSETLAEVISERFTIDDLFENDKLLTEGKTLKQIILDMEDEVLANAGVDVFEECFKLIFTKLYDEFESVRDRPRLLEFRNTGQTESELHEKISALFDKAKDKWKGVFDSGERVKLKRSHLPICVASLQNVRFFNSNLDIVDDAFEYLVNKSAKGEKGQYFTPRYVIDMCVKMLDPKENEYVVDTAAGSSGFTVHSIFHVWGKIFEALGMKKSEVHTAEKKPARCEDYVREKVFAIDFDEKSVRVAKTLNLIAGDGQTNVLYLNSLDYERWNDEINDKEWRKIYIQGFDRLQELGVNDKENRQFKFDVLLANPPFAGDIKETRVINKYDIAQKTNGKQEDKVGRDILFIERNLDFLKDGGRMAVVLPQGRFNNSSDKRIREYIAERCRILAVVGLHGNTFKPHTGTKTSVLFVQKWNEDKTSNSYCPRIEDYNIFFATQQKPAKDNSGEKLYRYKDGAFIRDEHGHFIVEHDLFNHEGLTEDGIAEAFQEFAKKENLSFATDFFRLSPFDEARYKALLNGQEITELTLSAVLEENVNLRIDSEYFKKGYLSNEYKLKSLSWDYLQSVSESIKSFGAYSLCNAVTYLDEGIPFLRGQNIKNGVVDFQDCYHIDKAGNELLWKSEVKPNMVLLTMSGSLGEAATALESWAYPVNSNQDIAKITTIDKLNPHYLTTFLNCKFGKIQMQRLPVGSVQQHTFIWQLEKLIIPKLSESFQTEIENLVKQAHAKLEESKASYAEAENLLLDTLGLQNWTPTTENISVKSFRESFLQAERIDSEYFHPEKQRILDWLGKFEGKSVSSYVSSINALIDPSKGFSSAPVCNYDLTDALEIYLDEKIQSQAMNSEARKKTMKKGDVVVSRLRSYLKEIAIVDTPEEANIVGSSEFIVLRLNDESVNAETLLVYLRSLPVQQILKWCQSGSNHPRFMEEDLLAVKLPDVILQLQNTIQTNVRDSITKSRKSKQLLEIAKRAVEIAIEQDEQIALRFIESAIY